MRYFIVDAFTAEPFAGNPAGVCLLESWPDAAVMQRIAGENNLPETAFILDGENGWEIRWFTPAFEMDLCGHATLASGYVILNCLQSHLAQVRFSSQSGPLQVTRQGDTYVLDFPSRPPVPVDVHPYVEQCLGVKVLGAFQSRDLIVLLENENDVRNLTPDFALMAKIPGLVGLVPTAAGDECDFVSRYFDPNDAIIEDPVTGSAHCTLIPFWAERLGKDEFIARQLSKRGGTLFCRDRGERVSIAGNAVLYLEGTLNI